IAKVEIGGRNSAVDVDDILERLRRARHVAGRGLDAAHLVAQESKDLLILFVATRVDGGDLLADPRGFCPLMLVFVQLLQIDEGVTVSRSGEYTSELQSLT